MIALLSVPSIPSSSARWILQRVGVVRLYRALGGGWDAVTDTLALPRPKEEER
jgi:hypothetical protein